MSSLKKKYQLNGLTQGVIIEVSRQIIIYNNILEILYINEVGPTYNSLHTNIKLRILNPIQVDNKNIFFKR